VPQSESHLPLENDRQSATEMAGATSEPWLPAETWLVVGSLALGAVLLGLLLWAGARFVPVP
jgi:hypothetical protein